MSRIEIPKRGRLPRRNVLSLKERGQQRKNPMATKRVLRAILKATDFCASDPAGAARQIVDGGYTALRLCATGHAGDPYHKWREYDPEDAIRFWALRLREGGMIKSSPQKIIAEGTDWRFLKEVKRELKA